MAARRIAQSTFNWAALAERVPENQKAQFLAFKTKSDNYARRMGANPEKPPEIDWQYYVNTVPIPGLVEEFRSKYDAFKIPVPSVDAHYAELEKVAKEVDQEITTIKAESDERIKSYQQELKTLQSLIPYENMTFEEMYIHAPHMGANRKDFWPHHLEAKKAAEH